MGRELVQASSRKWLSLLAFLAVCLGIGALGGAVTAKNVGTWYPTLAKPPFTPPDWLFAPVWTVLYIGIAVAGWRVWAAASGAAGTRGAMTAYAVQLALNLAWSFIFFGGHLIGAALADILLLLVAIGITGAWFLRIDRLAGWLLAPYGAWVAFASALNFALWRLN
jgi:benzodiazapine receptor